MYLFLEIDVDLHTHTYTNTNIHTHTHAFTLFPRLKIQAVVYSSFPVITRS